jgi:hypothetical protein
LKTTPTPTRLPALARVVGERYGLKVTYAELRKLVLDGLLDAELVGRTYLVPEAEVARIPGLLGRAPEGAA